MSAAAAAVREISRGEGRFLLVGGLPAFFCLVAAERGGLLPITPRMSHGAVIGQQICLEWRHACLMAPVLFFCTELCNDVSTSS